MGSAYTSIGHGRTPSGGYDPGTQGGGVQEHRQARRVAGYAAGQLQRRGVAATVEACPDGPRSHAPNWAGSVVRVNAAGVTVAVEVHFDWAQAPRGGFAIHGGDRASRDLAAAIRARYRQAGLRLRGDQSRPGLGFIRNSRADATILWECDRIGDWPASHLAAMGRAIADGVADHLGPAGAPTPPPTAGQHPGVVRGRRWLLRQALTGGPATRDFPFGRAGDVPLAGRWLPGRQGIGVRRGSKWLLRTSASGGSADVTFRYGKRSDVPVVGDWTGKGVDLPGVFRDGLWLLRRSLSGGGADLEFHFGRPGDVPVVGDWTGDGRTLPGVRRGNLWLLRTDLRGGPADVEIRYGSAGDVPVVGDWTGTGQTRIGVVRDGLWLLRTQRTQLAGGPADLEIWYGDPGDVPVVGDWS